MHHEFGLSIHYEKANELSAASNVISNTYVAKRLQTEINDNLQYKNTESVANNRTKLKKKGKNISK